MQISICLKKNFTHIVTFLKKNQQRTDVSFKSGDLVMTSVSLWIALVDLEHRYILEGHLICNISGLIAGLESMHTWGKTDVYRCF